MLITLASVCSFAAASFRGGTRQIIRSILQRADPVNIDFARADVPREK
jgi:hypothetical protein